MKHAVSLIALLCAALAYGYDLIPMPREVETTAPGRVKPGRIAFADGVDWPQTAADEGYKIEIGEDQILVTAAGEQGRQWAMRTLDQLADADGAYPQVVIRDWPEFPIRGFMYDTGRNFVEVPQLEEFIRLCSDYKLNVFHWHLTDKPAWRIECHAHPVLNDPRHQRIGREAGRYYTYADIRHILEYARERGVMVIPEIDMPGHSDYFTAAFGFPMNSPEGMAVLEDCLNEFFAEFPASEMPYVHIGSDEIHIDNPAEFMAWAVDMVEKAGRTPLVWDPGLDAGPNAVYQIWRDGLASPDAAGNGRSIVDSYMGYVNYVDPMMMTNRVFLHAPCSTGKSGPDELGGILCMWNDVRVTDDSRLPLHNGMMGAVLPFAERFWLGGKPNTPFRDALRPASDPDMQRLIEFQGRMQAHKRERLPELLGYWHANSPATEWNLALLDSAGRELYRGPAYGDVIDFDAVAAANGVEGAAQAVISRQIVAESDTALMCRIGFDAPARSNRLSDGIPQQGQWENFGAVSVNGEPVLPPVWQEPGLYRYHFNTWALPEEEQPYTDEQFYWMRQPVRVALRQGANTVELSTRKHFPGQRFQAAFIID